MTPYQWLRSQGKDPGCWPLSKVPIRVFEELGKANQPSPSLVITKRCCQVPGCPVQTTRSICSYHKGWTPGLPIPDQVKPFRSSPMHGENGMDYDQG